MEMGRDERPAAPVQALVVQASGVRDKIVLLAADLFARRAARDFQSGALVE